MADVSERPLGNRGCYQLLHRRGRHVPQARDLLRPRRDRTLFEKSPRAGITPGPDSAFMTQVACNLTDPVDGFLRGKRFLILDRDKKFTAEFRATIEDAGTDVIRLPYRSPNLNAYVERFVLSIKSECLDRMIFFGEQSLRRAVRRIRSSLSCRAKSSGVGKRVDRSGRARGRSRRECAMPQTTGRLAQLLPPRSRIGVSARRRAARCRGSVGRSPFAESGRRRFVSAIS